MALTKVSSGIIDSAPIGIHSGGTLIHSASTDLNFVGTGHTFTVNGGTTNISLAGGGACGASKVHNETIFAYQNVVDADVTISAPYSTGTIYASEDVTVDIEEGITLTIDDNCALNIIAI